MKQAIGVVETCGMPSALVTADVMGKAADVQVVGLENTHAGRISVIIRGPTGAVQSAIAAATQALRDRPGIALLGHHIVPCPDESVDIVGLGGLNRSATAAEEVTWLDD